MDRSFTEEQAQACIDRLPKYDGYSYSVNNDDPFNIYVLVTGPNGWECSFSVPEATDWAINVIEANFTA